MKRIVHQNPSQLGFLPSLVGQIDRLHAEITADYNDMIYAATREEIETRWKAFIRKWRSLAPSPTVRRKSAGLCSLPNRPTCARSMAGKCSPQSPLISQLTSPRNHIASRDYAARHSNRIPDGTIAPYMFVFLIALYIVFG